MQLNPIYLYSNKVDVFTSLDTWTTERYRKVYQRNLKVYRGVDNRLDFHVKNGDEKPQPITNLTVVFNIIGTESKELVIQKDCTVNDVTKGRVSVTLSQADIENIQAGHYHYSLYTQTAQGVKTPLYSDSQYGAVGVIDVIDHAYGEPLPSIESPLRDVAGDKVTDEFDARPEFNSNSGLHTFAFYSTCYVGSLAIEATMDDSAGDTWVTVEQFNLNNEPLTYKNVTGVWTRLRIKETAKTAGSLDNVMYRY
jgi:BppU N-terminal domain